MVMMVIIFGKMLTINMTASNGNEYEDDDIQHQHQMLVERKKDIFIVECKDRIGVVVNVDADGVTNDEDDSDAVVGDDDDDDDDTTRTSPNSAVHCHAMAGTRPSGPLPCVYSS